MLMIVDNSNIRWFKKFLFGVIGLQLYKSFLNLKEMEQQPGSTEKEGAPG